jgi:hypothetical protein
MRLIVCLTGPLLIGTPTALASQERTPTDTAGKLIVSTRAIAAGLAAAPPTRVQSSRDSVKAGAVIGGIAAGVSAVYICTAVSVEGDPPCWRGVLVVGVMGAGIGAAVGAVIDAIASQRHPTPTWPRK